MTTEIKESLPKPQQKQSASKTDWYLYIVETRFGHWYTGITTDVAKRIDAHQTGKGAKNLKGKGPLVLIYQCYVGTRSDATKLEIKVKKLSKAQKRLFVLRGH
ncbi:GIY-YIG nuclease family protein [Pseudoalteromonas mariniglutinosa]|uniref:GIY-YIG nuclease family protein n=1 Tax=Pseudoalteromonas mariniglutinosa TaxID=206042 RepID=UPI003850DC4E